jgi:hypothetical protein
MHLLIDYWCYLSTTIADRLTSLLSLMRTIILGNSHGKRLQCSNSNLCVLYIERYTLNLHACHGVIADRFQFSMHDTTEDNEGLYIYCITVRFQLVVC